MSLSLLAPLALGLGALVALPIIAHIARQKPRERVPFGAMLLLRRVVKRLRRRRRVRDPILLLLRILAVALIVLAVSGLRWSYQGGTPEFGGTGRVVLVVDRSMSMSLMDGGSTLLARARADAETVLDGLPPGTLIGAVAFDDEAMPLTDGLVGDASAIRARLDALQPTLGRSNLREALLEARRQLEGEPGEIYLFSDEAGPIMVPEAKEELRRIVDAGSAVVPRPVTAEARNVAVTKASYGEGIEGGTIEVRVANFGPEAIEVPCEVSLPDGQVIPFFADLPPEGEVLERVTVPREAAGGVGEATCEDPGLPGDDARYFHLPRVGASRVMVVDGDPGDTPIRSEVYFLERALAPWGGSRSGVQPQVTTPMGLLELDAEDHQVVFLANVADPRTFAPKLSEFVRKGGAVVISAGGNVSPDRYNASLGGLLPAPLRRVEDIAAREELGVPLEAPDGAIELFEPFSRAGRSAFDEVRSRRIVLLDPYQEGQDVRTLLRYAGGAPALVERDVGQGKVLLWTSSLDYDWSSLPTQAVFMPLVQRIVGYLGADAGGGAGRIEATVGRSVPIELPDLAMQPEIIGPDGQPVPSRIEGTTLLFTPEKPGAYEVKVEAVPTLMWIAANLDPAESDVRSYDSVAAAEASIRPELFTRYVDLSPWLWAGGLALLLASAALALAYTLTARETESPGGAA